MSTTGGGRTSRSAATLAGWTAATAAAVTLAVVTLPFLGFAYRAPALRVVLETSNALTALVVAYLVYGRFRSGRRRPDLLLVLALCTVAIANLALTALPSAIALAREEEFHRWEALAIRLLGTVLLAAAALVPPDRTARPRESGYAVGAIAVAVVALVAAGVLFGEHLPPTVDPGLAPADATEPRLVAHPAVLAVQGVGAALYATAAVAFTRRALRTGDELLRWVGAGCVLAAFARLHYLLFPSLYSEYVYTGDLLRLGFYVFMLVGATREIRAYWELRARTAVLEDRRRMARDLHDGLAQELSYIRAQSQRLAARPDDPHGVHRIQAAAGRAAEEARRAISALTRPVGEAFPAALRRQLAEASHRHDLEIVADLDEAVDVDAAQDEALLRIVSEAVHNAVRHGAASRIEVGLTREPPCLIVRDDGQGFDTTAARGGGFGLTSMRERAAGFGGRIAVTSAPGAGTTVRVTWP